MAAVNLKRGGAIAVRQGSRDVAAIRLKRGGAIAVLGRSRDAAAIHLKRGRASAAYSEVQCHRLALWGIASMLVENQMTACLGTGVFFISSSVFSARSFFLPPHFQDAGPAGRKM